MKLRRKGSIPKTKKKQRVYNKKPKAKKSRRLVPLLFIGCSTGALLAILTVSGGVDLFSPDAFYMTGDNSGNLADFTRPLSTSNVIGIMNGAHLPDALCFSDDDGGADKCILNNVLTVRADTTIIVQNDDSTTHSLTSGLIMPSGKFITGEISSGSEKSFEIKEPGTYDWHCMLHPHLTGKIIVI